jgi:hypothetical protein
MGRACSTQVDTRNAYKTVGKFENYLGRLDIDDRVILDWIHLPQSREQ